MHFFTLYRSKYGAPIEFGQDLPEKFLKYHGFEVQKIEVLGCDDTNYNNRSPDSFITHMKSNKEPV